MAQTYECKLDEASLQKAKKELNEDPNERMGTVKALQEWVEREPWITAPTDPLFLLSFLRSCKFSQLKARQKLSKYMSAISKDGVYNFLLGTDPGSEKTLKILRESQVYIIPSGFDKEGRKVVIGRFGKMDSSGKSYKYNEYVAALMPLFHSMMFFDERIQVNGIVFLMDFADVSMSMISFIGVENMKRQSEQTNNIPCRIKSINYYNTGPVFESMMALFRPFLTQKLKDRIKVHGPSLPSVYKVIDKSMLPEEYLPDDHVGASAGSTQNILEENIQEFLLDPERRAFLKDLYSGKYGADLKERDRSSEPQASFRKLNVS